MPDELDELSDPVAAGKVVVVEGVENDAAVDVDVLAEGVVLKGETSVNHRRSHVLLLLLGLLSEKSLVQLKVLQRRLNPHVSLVLQLVDNLTMQRHALSSPSVPLFQHPVVSLLLLEPHLHQHPHLLRLHFPHLLLPSPAHRCVRLVHSIFLPTSS